ncbi:hypothetical protein IscW_ISCW021034 [Ixodes scapularis]|uniref:Uncharacterized protein n=1 Tax=Ixodes scapularis TaxID=6945 RepID=B7Q9V9_IXOSC|nr:hypothetical protein IscW_ISCW021034 [Ixodes scapularis]|eukprot:XP_002406381.1 hypothetical protein IscW_ISCW021034 [Ixodes scapularis]
MRALTDITSAFTRPASRCPSPEPKLPSSLWERAHTERAGFNGFDRSAAKRPRARTKVGLAVTLENDPAPATGPQRAKERSDDAIQGARNPGFLAPRQAAEC